jgi:Transposase DDE domain
MHIDYFIIEMYCLVSDAMQEICKDIKLRERGFKPKITDAEVLTIEMVGEYMGMSQDKAIWMHFKTYYSKWFPNLGSRSTFVKQSANLHCVKQQLHAYLVNKMNANKSDVYIVDGFPIPVCSRARVFYSKNFRGQADYGVCVSKNLRYYGFKGLLVLNKDGVIIDLNVAPANIDERDMLAEMPLEIKGLLLGDKGFIRPELTSSLAKHGIKLATPIKKNMQKTANNIFTGWMFKARRLIETVIGQCTDRFSMQNNGAKDIWHLKSRIYRKVVCHTLCIIINRKRGNNLDIAKLVCA